MASVLPTHRHAGIGGQLWDAACTPLRGTALAPLYLETLAELPCCAFYNARGGEVLTRTAGTFFGGAVTFLDYFWPAGKPHQRHQDAARASDFVDQPLSIDEAHPSRGADDEALLPQTLQRRT